MTMNPAVSNKPLSRVKLMDAPSVLFALPSDSAALSASAEEWHTSRMIQQGGKVAVATGEEADGSGYRLAAGDLIWDHSDLLHYQVIVARVEPWGVSIVPKNGTELTPETDFQWVAVCREGSAATPLLKALAWGAWLAASVLAGVFLAGGWAVLLILALLLFTAWIVLRPSQRSVRRMLRMAA